MVVPGDEVRLAGAFSAGGSLWMSERICVVDEDTISLHVGLPVQVAVGQVPSSMNSHTRTPQNFHAGFSQCK